jgi:antitoxin MazE
METRVKKWGNSLALRIPKSLAQEAGLVYDSSVEISIVDGNLVVAPVAASEWRLDDLLAQVTQDCLHGEVDAGPSVGREVW